MKKVYCLLLFVFTLSLFLVSCSSDDDVVSLDTSNGKIKMYSKGTYSLAITRGNGGYVATSSDEKIATVSIKDNIVLIKGIKAGEVTITIADKEDRSVVVEVELYEEFFKYKVIDKASIYAIKGEVSNDERKAIEDQISDFFIAETGGFYEFLRNDIYTGNFSVYPSGIASYLFTGTFTAASNNLRLEKRDDKNEVIEAFMYYGIKYEPTKSSETFLPFNFYDDMMLVIDCTEHFKKSYPKLTGLAFGQRLQRIGTDK